MTNFYTQNYIEKVTKQKKKSLVAYFIVAAILALIIIASIVVNSLLPYNYGHRPYLLTIVCTATVMLVIYSFLYLQICYGRVAAYLNFLNSLFQRKKITSTATIIRVNGQVNSGNIDYYTIDILEWSNAEENYIERSLFVDAEFKDLDFKKDEIVTIETASNYLIAYEKGAN